MKTLHIFLILFLLGTVPAFTYQNDHQPYIASLGINASHGLIAFGTVKGKHYIGGSVDQLGFSDSIGGYIYPGLHYYYKILHKHSPYCGIALFPVKKGSSFAYDLAFSPGFEIAFSRYRISIEYDLYVPLYSGAFHHHPGFSVGYNLGRIKRKARKR